MSDENEREEESDGVPPIAGVFPFHIATPDEVQKHHRHQQQQHDLQLELNQQTLHEFYDSLTLEQMRQFYAIIAGIASGWTSGASFHTGLAQTYMRLKHNFNAATNAPVGEKLGLNGLDTFNMEDDTSE